MKKFSGRSIIASLGVGLVLAGTLTACSTAREVPMQPAVNANDPACADVIVRLPPEVADQERRRTNAQSTGAWGDPAAIELYCGIEPSGPTTDECVSVNGIDWIRDGSAAPIFRFEAYGREPGLEVIVNGDLASGTEALLDLNSAVSQLPQVRQCTSLLDEIEFG